MVGSKIPTAGNQEATYRGYLGGIRHYSENGVNDHNPHYLKRFQANLLSPLLGSGRYDTQAQPHGMQYLMDRDPCWIAAFAQARNRVLSPISAGRATSAMPWALT